MKHIKNSLDIIWTGLALALMFSLSISTLRAQQPEPSAKKPRPDAPAMVFLSLTDTGFASPEVRVKKQSMLFTVVNSSPSITVDLEIKKYDGSVLLAAPEPQTLKSAIGRYKASAAIDLPPGRYRVQQKGMSQWGFDLIVEAPANVE